MIEIDGYVLTDCPVCFSRAMDKEKNLRTVCIWSQVEMIINRNCKIAMEFEKSQDFKH